MPIRPELRPLYPPHWRELSSHVRFERAEAKATGPSGSVALTASQACIYEAKRHDAFKTSCRP
jgi:hypothetical protein